MKTNYEFDEAQYLKEKKERRDKIPYVVMRLKKDVAEFVSEEMTKMSKRHVSLIYRKWVGILGTDLEPYEACDTYVQQFKNASNHVEKLGLFTEQDMEEMAIDSAICNFGDSPSRKEKRQQWHQKMMYFYLKGNLPEEAVNWFNPFD